MNGQHDLGVGDEGLVGSAGAKSVTCTLQFPSEPSSLLLSFVATELESSSGALWKGSGGSGGGSGVCAVVVDAGTTDVSSMDRPERRGVIIVCVCVCVCVYETERKYHCSHGGLGVGVWG